MNNDRSFGLDRRQFLKVAGLGIGAVSIATLTGCNVFSSRGTVSTFGEVDFATPLHIPPLAESTIADGRRVFDLVAQQGRTPIVPGGDAETWG